MDTTVIDPALLAVAEQTVADTYNSLIKSGDYEQEVDALSHLLDVIAWLRRT